jgi:hypothetical protein
VFLIFPTIEQEGKSSPGVGLILGQQVLDQGPQPRVAAAGLVQMSPPRFPMVSHGRRENFTDLPPAPGAYRVGPVFAHRFAASLVAIVSTLAVRVQSYWFVLIQAFEVIRHDVLPGRP